MNASDFVVLSGGLTIPLSVLRALWDLEARGASIRLDTDGDGIIVTPKTLVTDEDRAVIRRYRSHVVEVLRYEPKARTQ